MDPESLWCKLETAVDEDAARRLLTEFVKEVGHSYYNYNDLVVFILYIRTRAISLLVAVWLLRRYVSQLSRDARVYILFPLIETLSSYYTTL